MMVKTGVVKAGVTPCSLSGEHSEKIVGAEAIAKGMEKQAKKLQQQERTLVEELFDSDGK
jgi:hypothetical protein